MKQIDEYAQKFPIYSLSNFDSSLLGSILMQTDIQYLKQMIIDDDNNSTIDEHNIDIDNQLNDTTSNMSDDSQETIQENSNNQVVQECDNIIPLSTLSDIPNKKLLWSLHFKFVPQYISLYRQSILFASDRWGFVR